MEPTITTCGPDAQPKGRVRARLEVLHAPGGRTGTWTLAPGRLQIGREEGPDRLGLPEDARLSRHHATLGIAAEGRAVRLEACPGRNGTFVNRVRMPETGGQSLADGDVLRLGDCFFLLRLAAEHAPDADVPEILGNSPVIAALRSSVVRIARDPATVLLRGETGTGKEVVSRAIHRASGRKGELVAVNCGAIPHELAESQLFGHLSGAFTGARPHLGFFRAADGGTLLLDELGEIPLLLQPKLLRALEERAVTPLGATSPSPYNARVIAATNRDLERDILEGQFRKDLYARLTDVVLFLPPLRDRREDILPLLRHAGAETRDLPADLIETLLFHAWPLNVREVVKIASHLRLFGPDESLRERLRTASMLGPGVGTAHASPVQPAEPDKGSPPRLAAPSREELEALMARHNGVIQEVALELGWSRRQVGRWLETLGVERSRYRQGGEE